MAKLYNEISESLKSFIEQQKIFFVATATADGRINLSPKGGDYLRVIDETRLIWLNLTGSGNETAAHMQIHNRITIMFCSFVDNPMILRLYGKGEILHEDSPAWPGLITRFPANTGARQIFDITIDAVQTSCGFQVPFYEYRGERDTLDKWSEKKGRDGIRQYWQETNSLSLDGLPTGISSQP